MSAIDLDEFGINVQQAAYCERYIIHYNGTQAAIEAGYSPDSASSQSSKLLAQPGVQAYLQYLRDRVVQSAVFDANYVLEGYKRIADHGLTMVQRVDKDGKPVVVRGKRAGSEDVVEIELFDLLDAPEASKALEKLGKNMGLFKDRVVHTGNVRMSHEEALKELE